MRYIEKDILTAIQIETTHHCNSIMKRVYGSKGLALIECINPRLMKYRVRWDILPYFDENGEEQGVTFYEAEVTHKPSIDEVKDIILSGFNQAIDEKIMSGFVWNGMSIWLSTENQFNYKAAYDLAVMSDGKALPVTFKFGTTKEPVYYTFETLNELSDFYIKAMDYIAKTLQEGWIAKDSIVWADYERELSVQ